MTESQNSEYKRSWRDEYLKWICGFANAQGGIPVQISVYDDRIMLWNPGQLPPDWTVTMLPMPYSVLV